MKSLNLLLVYAFCCINIGYSQTDTTKIIKPLLLDKEVLSGIGLKKIKIKKEPERDFFQKNLFHGKDISVYVVSSESWTSSFDKFWFDEFVYIFNGKAKITSENKEQQFQSGEFFFAPKDFKGKWEIKAGKNYHYELSVITTKRADSSKISENHTPILIDRSKLSGVDIVLDRNRLYQEVLSKGVELTILLKAEKPRELAINEPAKEQLIYVLSGQVSVTDASKNIHIFNTGDFFVLPNGFIGNWKSNGHGLFKYLTVQKSE